MHSTAHKAARSTQNCARGCAASNNPATALAKLVDRRKQPVNALILKLHNRTVKPASRAVEFESAQCIPQLTKLREALKTAPNAALLAITLQPRWQSWSTKQPVKALDFKLPKPCCQVLQPCCRI
jgi:hypothetical protein